MRRGSLDIAMADFETARDRVLLGQRRESMVLSDEEKERIAYHEGGHAVLAYVLEHADPVHKVTILPTGMALGVTHQLPMEERHIHPRATSRTRCVSAWAAGAPRSWSTATSRPVRPTTSSATPSWPARWSANGA